MNYEVVGESEGHTWIKEFGFVSCRDCGFLRRLNGEKNKPCPGRVRVMLRGLRGQMSSDGEGVPSDHWCGGCGGQDVAKCRA